MTEPTQSSNPNTNSSVNSSTHPNTKAPWPVIGVIIAIILGIVIWQLSSDKVPEQAVIATPIATPLPIAPPIATPTPVAVEIVIPDIVEPEPVKVVIEDPLPNLDESDSWVQEKLPNVTWREELLKLIINQDMIRRFVVFVDNFSQGDIAYQHSPLVNPAVSFTANELPLNENKQAVWQWDENTSKRFSLYVDLFRSLDSDKLVQWYYESKPLIDEAYQELGYDDDFTDTLQAAFDKVLDMEIPKEPIELIRPSVMFKYQDQALEDLSDAEKLLLRLGKDNLLVIKSVILEVNDKFNQSELN